MRPASWLCLAAGVLITASARPWAWSILGIALCAASIGLFLGSQAALQSALLLGRAFVLLILPLILWPWLQLHIWQSPAWLLLDVLRREVMPALAVPAVLVLLEVTRWRLRLPLRATWHATALATAALILLGRGIPAFVARTHTDPAAAELAKHLVAAAAVDPSVFRRDEWWQEPPWNALTTTPAWQRPVMKCDFFGNHGGGFDLGSTGINPWFRHPLAGQPPGLVDYHFRDGSRWRGVTVTRYVTHRTGTRYRMIMELRVAHSPPTGPTARTACSRPELFPEP